MSSDLERLILGLEEAAVLVSRSSSTQQAVDALDQLASGTADPFDIHLVRNVHFGHRQLSAVLARRHERVPVHRAAPPVLVAVLELVEVLRPSEQRGGVLLLEVFLHFLHLWPTLSLASQDETWLALGGPATRSCWACV